VTTMKHDAFSRRHPVFRGEELAEHLSSSGRVGARMQESLVAYHTRTGRLVRIRRGLFAVMPTDADGCRRRHLSDRPLPGSFQAYAGLRPVSPYGAGVPRARILGLAAVHISVVASAGYVYVPLPGLPGDPIPGGACAFGRGELRCVDDGARRTAFAGHQS